MELKPSTKLTPKDFVTLLSPYAKETEKKSGISASFILAQAALESGWNSSSPKWMFFGVKDTDGLNGNEQLLRTTEYLSHDKVKFPEVISVTWDSTKKLFHYVVKDYFRAYKSPEECFTDHANFFVKNSRYKAALLVKNDPYKFATEIAKAKYATAPDYEQTLHKMIDLIKKFV